MKRLVYICDWLPPDFGAVGQYSVLFAREWAQDGWAVTLVGLTSGSSERGRPEAVGAGTVEIVRIHRRALDKRKFAARLLWTLVSNLLLVRAASGAMRRADAVLFTGSPPLMIHFVMPLAKALGKRVIYRITDFYPECLIAERGRAGLVLKLIAGLTYFWRRRVDCFEVLGADQMQRLLALGIPRERIRLKRDPSPVRFGAKAGALELPEPLRGQAGVLLYSGNWGVAHDARTFLDAYVQYRRHAKHGLGLWLNAVGSKADQVETALRRENAFVHRSALVPLEELPAVLLAADVHLITLRDPFVGYVLPSKIYACIESGKRILFVGSTQSDVHSLASRALGPGRYFRVDVGDVGGLVRTLHEIEATVAREQSRVAV
jgi:Glycosyl transferase 4-like domain